LSPPWQKKKREQLLYFIDAYRSLPELWDIECPSYSNRIKKAAAYNVLIEKLKPLEPDAVRDSVKKINNLRSTFRKELKKVNDSKRSSAGSDDVYVPSLWYFNELMFLVDQETPDTSELTFAVDNAVDNENGQNSVSERALYSVFIFI
jgi:CO dehydrogenase/acetyl-CoA synthase gamma subunit (corrinoid Fe-S protein)